MRRVIGRSRDGVGLTDDGAEKVVEGDHADDGAVFVDDEGDVRGPATGSSAELVKHFDGGRAFGNIDRRAGNGGEVDFVGDESGVDKIFDVNDADELVEACAGALARMVGGIMGVRDGLADGVMGVICGRENNADALDGVVGEEVVNVGARDHERGDAHVGEFEDPLDEFAFFFVKDAGLSTRGEEGFDFILSGIVACARAEGDKTEDEFGGGGEEPDERSRADGNEAHDRRAPCGDGLSASLTDAFGDDLSEHEGEIGEDEHGHDQGDGAGPGGDFRDFGETIAQAIGDGSFAESPHEDGDEGDADLDGGEELGGLFKQSEGDPCTQITAISTGLKAGLSGGDEGHFHHHKEGVGEDEDGDEDEQHE